MGQRRRRVEGLADRTVLRARNEELYWAEELERRVLLSTAIAAFVPQLTFASGSQPRSVTTADVNGDGKLDLIVANGGSGSVGVMLGNGNGTFQNQVTFAVGTGPFSVAAADVNRDGKLDLVTANNGSGTVSVLLGNGNGTFLAQQTFAAGTQARSVAIGDLNGDGKPDLAVANYGAGTVSVLLGNGNGTFLGQQTFAAGTQASSVAIADLNRDGKLDLAVADKSPSTVSVLLGNGNGTFATRATFGAGTLPFSVASGDVNGDGKLDLVLAEESSNSVGVLLGNGNGTFANQATFSVGSIPASVVVTDINGDGKLDIAAANYSSNSVSVLLGNGNGSFQSQKTFGTGNEPFALTGADVNRDGRVDLVVANFGGSSASVLLGDVPPYVVSINRSNPVGPTTSATSVSYAVTFSEPVTGVDTTDFSLVLNGVTVSNPVGVSGGGSAYTVTVSGISGTGSLALNLVDDGSIKDLAGNPLQQGNALTYQSEATFATGVDPYAATVADLNGDGQPDLLVVNSQSNTLGVLLGTGGGAFGLQRTFATMQTPSSVVAADVNGDGKLDAVVANLNGGISVLLGNGDGTFQGQSTIASGSGLRSVRVADVNRDGKLDIVVVANGSNFIGVLLGNGDGTFQAPRTLSAGPSAWAVAVGDFNGDGIPDLAIADAGTSPSYSGVVGVALGNGDGTFQAQQTLATIGNPRAVGVADVNGDGKMDIVASGRARAAISVLLGNGNGTFVPQQTSATGSEAYSLSIADVNGDGKPDVITASDYGQGPISVSLGNGNGFFGNAQTLAGGAYPSSILAPDLNGDGRPDLLFVNNHGNTAGEFIAAPSASVNGPSYVIVTPVVFDAGTSNGAGHNPYSVAVSDFNGDGKPDLVSSNVSSGFVSVFLGNGNGTFQPQTTVYSGGGNYSVAAGDVNGDGKPDIVVADFARNMVGVMLGNGNGTFGGFSALETFATGVRPEYVVIADVNEDGKPDILAVNDSSSSNSISVLLGNGDGTFQAQRVIATGANPFGLAVADVNRDGHPDLIVTNVDDNDVGILLGNGDGTFGPQTTYSTGASSLPRSVAVGDVNGDGKPDIVAAHGSVVSVLLGNGDGTFQPQQTMPTHAGASSGDVAIVDMNGDGKPDLVVANAGSGAGIPGSNNVGVLLGNGNGTFQAEQTFAGGTVPAGIAVGDFNRDGKPDIAVTDDSNPGAVNILLGHAGPMVLSINRTNPGTVFTNAASVSFTVTFSEPVTGVDASDFALSLSGVTTSAPIVTGSGAVYTVTVNGITGTGKLGLNVIDNGSIHDGDGLALGPGGEAAFQRAVLPGAGPYPTFVGVADLNRDGHPDLIATSINFNALIVQLGNGDGTFRQQGGGSLPVSPIGTEIADVNGDGKPDAIVVDVNGSRIDILPGNGDGSFQPPQTFFAGAYPWAVASGDVNGDGKVDLVVAGDPFNKPGTISVLLGNGNGSFQAPTSYAVGNSPVAIALADMNGDGRLDVITADAGVGNVPGAISVLLGNGDGTFEAQQTFGAGYGARSIAVADVNGDGKADVVVGNVTEGAVSVLLGNGDGSLQTLQSFAAGSSPASVVIADLNGDGKPDIVVANSDSISESISVLLGNGNGSFRALESFDTLGSSPRDLAVADLNGDGRLDVVTANYSSDTLSVLLGTSNGSFIGQSYTIVGSADRYDGSLSADTITLTRDVDGQHIDWNDGFTGGVIPINDPNGLTLNGNGGDDVIVLDYTNGNPLPNTLHLNGTFTINGLQGGNPFSGTTIEVGQSTVYFGYAPGSSPVAAIQAALASGYNGGLWNGLAGALTGAITSSAAASGPMNTFGIGYADSADGVVAGQPVNTVEIRYTVMGDANLDRVVDANDALLMTRHWGAAGSPGWDMGNFNYDATIDLGDATLLQKNWNGTATGTAMPAAALATPTSAVSMGATAQAQRTAANLQEAAAVNASSLGNTDWELVGKGAEMGNGRLRRDRGRVRRWD